MESKWHRLVCKVLYDLLHAVFGDRLLLAWDQFLYWDARDPGAKAAPDVFGRTDRPDRIFPSWKVWELGAPEFVIEVVSESSWPEDVTDKPPIYDRLGVTELVVFDPEPETRAASRGQTPRELRVWRRLDGALVEVAVQEDRYYSEVLGLWLRAVPAAEGRRWLRLARGERGEDLVPTPEEEAAARQQAEAARQQAEAARQQAEAARDQEARARREAEETLARLRAEIESLRRGR